MIKDSEHLHAEIEGERVDKGGGVVGWGGVDSPTLLEGSQVSSARLSGKSSIKLKRMKQKIGRNEKQVLT